MTQHRSNVWTSVTYIHRVCIYSYQVYRTREIHTNHMYPSCTRSMLCTYICWMNGYIVYMSHLSSPFIYTHQVIYAPIIVLVWVHTCLTIYQPFEKFDPILDRFVNAVRHDVPGLYECAVLQTHKDNWRIYIYTAMQYTKCVRSMRHYMWYIYLPTNRLAITTANMNNTYNTYINTHPYAYSVRMCQGANIPGELPTIEGVLGCCLNRRGCTSYVCSRVCTWTSSGLRIDCMLIMRFAARRLMM